jgi:hypothetical protein
MRVVYKAEDTKLGRLAGLKTANDSSARAAAILDDSP